MNIDWWCLKVDESSSHPFFSWSTNNSSKKIGGINACIILIFFLHCLLIYMFIDLVFIIGMQGPQWKLKALQQLNGVIIGWGFQLSIELVCNWQNKKSMKPICNMMNIPIRSMIALSKTLFLMFMQWGGDVS